MKLNGTIAGKLDSFIKLHVTVSKKKILKTSCDSVISYESYIAQRVGGA